MRRTVLEGGDKIKDKMKGKSNLNVNANARKEAGIGDFRTLKVVESLSTTTIYANAPELVKASGRMWSCQILQIMGVVMIL